MTGPPRPARAGPWLPRAKAAREPGRRVMLRFAKVLIRVPRYLRLAYRLARDERLTAGQRALAAAGVAYSVSPLDPIPGIIPIVGQLDCLAVLLLSLRQALRSCEPEVAADHLRQSGLTTATIDGDLATIRSTAMWVVFQVGRAARHVSNGLVRAARARASKAVARFTSRKMTNEQ